MAYRDVAPCVASRQAKQPQSKNKTRAIDGLACFKLTQTERPHKVPTETKTQSKQASKQTSKQASKQARKQASKQAESKESRGIDHSTL